MGTTGGLGRVRRLSPVRLRSNNRGRGVLNELFSRLHRGGVRHHYPTKNLSPVAPTPRHAIANRRRKCNLDELREWLRRILFTYAAEDI